jgi:hypothetical protein
VSANEKKNMARIKEGHQAKSGIATDSQGGGKRSQSVTAVA